MTPEQLEFQHDQDQEQHHSSHAEMTPEHRAVGVIVDKPTMTTMQLNNILLTYKITVQN